MFFGQETHLSLEISLLQVLDTHLKKINNNNNNVCPRTRQRVRSHATVSGLSDIGVWRSEFPGRVESRGFTILASTLVVPGRYLPKSCSCVVLVSIQGSNSPSPRISLYLSTRYLTTGNLYILWLLENLVAPIHRWTTSSVGDSKSKKWTLLSLFWLERLDNSLVYSITCTFTRHWTTREPMCILLWQQWWVISGFQN